MSCKPPNTLQLLATRPSILGCDCAWFCHSLSSMEASNSSCCFGEWYFYWKKSLVIQVDRGKCLRTYQKAKPLVISRINLIQDMWRNNSTTSSGKLAPTPINSSDRAQCFPSQSPIASTVDMMPYNPAAIAANCKVWGGICAKCCSTQEMMNRWLGKAYSDIPRRTPANQSAIALFASAIAELAL